MLAVGIGAGEVDACELVVGVPGTLAAGFVVASGGGTAAGMDAGADAGLLIAMVVTGLAGEPSSCSCTLAYSHRTVF